MRGFNRNSAYHLKRHSGLVKAHRRTRTGEANTLCIHPSPCVKNVCFCPCLAHIVDRCQDGYMYIVSCKTLCPSESRDLRSGSARIHHV